MVIEPAAEYRTDGGRWQPLVTFTSRCLDSRDIVNSGSDLAFFYPLDEIEDCRLRGHWYTQFGCLCDDCAVDKFDFRSATLSHIMCSGRRPFIGHARHPATDHMFHRLDRCTVTICRGFKSIGWNSAYGFDVEAERT